MNWKKIITSLLIFFFLIFFNTSAAKADNDTYCQWNSQTNGCQQVINCDSGCVPPNLNCPNRFKQELCIGTPTTPCNCAGPSTLSCTYFPAPRTAPVTEGTCQRSGSCGAGYQPSPQSDPCYSTSISENECLSRSAGTCVPVPILQPSPAGGTYEICQGNQDCLDCITPGAKYINGGSWTALGCINTGDPSEFITWVLKSAIGIAGGIATLLIIFSGMLIILSTGDPKRLQTGKEILTSAIVGLLMIIFSIFLLQLIGVQILKIPGFGTP